ncbi:hypothetical protein CLV98_1144 [Dyadobacter jejuensis]|uniref:Uncharacterized protein n=1 Tax=Dyadobacter jejuensis TaxID=1082580 RepID=A0A316ABT4_9BACT|nr:hypothetical protein CLV98_1144 [Dyadobacter jejuensis]
MLSFSKYYESMHVSANLRTSSNNESLTLDELCSIIDPIIKKYPDLRDDIPFIKTELKRIYQDFPAP